MEGENDGKGKYDDVQGHKHHVVCGGNRFLIVAFLGHESGYSTAAACFAARACMDVRRRKESEE